MGGVAATTCLFYAKRGAERLLIECRVQCKIRSGSVHRKRALAAAPLGMIEGATGFGQLALQFSRPLALRLEELTQLLNLLVQRGRRLQRAPVGVG